MIDNRHHYTYLITHVSSGKRYIGKRSSYIEPEEDLGIKYFSHSTDKIFMKDQKQNPQNYNYEITGRFTTEKLALSYEIWLHAKYKVASNLKFFNLAEQTSNGFISNNGIPVYQIDPYTKNIIKLWDNVKQAEETLGMNPHSVAACVNPNSCQKTSDGFFWVRDLKDLPGKEYKNYYSFIPVWQVSKDGKIISRFETLALAAKAFGTNQSYIRCAADPGHKRQTTKGFLWTFDPEVIPVLRKHGGSGSNNSKSKKVYRFDRYTKILIGLWDTVKEASLALGVPPAGIAQAANPDYKRKIVKDSIWSYDNII